MHWGLFWNLSDLTVTSSQYNILLRSETLNGLGYASRVGVAGSRIWSSCFVVSGQDVLGLRDGCMHTCEMDIEQFANSNLSMVVAKCWFIGLVRLFRKGLMRLKISFLNKVNRGNVVAAMH